MLGTSDTATIETQIPYLSLRQKPQFRMKAQTLFQARTVFCPQDPVQHVSIIRSLITPNLFAHVAASLLFPTSCFEHITTVTSLSVLAVNPYPSVSNLFLIISCILQTAFVTVNFKKRVASFLERPHIIKI